MMLAASALALAIVVQDPVALRAAPRESAAQQARLWQGDSLEIRGEKGDFLQVWDHRRERGGYVRASQVRSLSMNAAGAAQMLAVMEFLRDTPGQEALGIGYAAAFLKAASPEQIGPEAFDALGSMAERLARRASQPRGNVGDTLTAEQLEVAAAYGVGMQSFERDGRMQLCYDGEAFRRVMALPQSTPLLKARAALALTRHDCVSPDLSLTQRAELDAWRIDLLSRVDTSQLPGHMKNRIFMRRAGILASLAWQAQRRGPEGDKRAREAAGLAVESLAAVNKNALGEDDAMAYSEAATRAGVSRWFAADAQRVQSTLSVRTHPGQPGETCVQLVEAKQKAPLFERCTWGIVHPASAAANADHGALALAVQTLDTWRELWLFRKGEAGWYLEVIPPSASGPDIGYLDFAGWVPGGKQLLTVREARVEGRYQRRFELMNLDSLQVERWADKPESLTPFYRWQDPVWKRLTLSLR